MIKEANKYTLDIQLFGEEAPEKTEQDDTKTEQQIDFDKFDANKEPEEEKVDDVTELKKQLEKERLKAQEAEKRAQKVKDAFDKAASDRAKLNRQLQKTESEAQEPMEKLLEYEQKLAEYQLKEKKTNLTYSLTESLGVSKDMSDELVGAIYHEDTNEVSVGDLEIGLRKLVDHVRKAAYEEGYETRDTELASNKPRSLGNNKGLSIEEQKRQEYIERHSKGR